VTGLFGWVGREGDGAGEVAVGMACALQAHPGEAWAVHEVDAMAIGVLDGIRPDRAAESARPAWSADGRHALWLAGEIFEGGDLPIDDPADAVTAAARTAILTRLIAEGPQALIALDGEYQMAWWDRATRSLRLLNDRFGGLPIYWSAPASGVAFACGVRGALMAPGVDAAADVEAIREAATFGGFRLGGRTSVSSVRMLPGGSVATIAGGTVSERRYWSWSDIAAEQEISAAAAIDGLHERWRRAIARRLRGARRPGQTLSGGLDSRAILAEAAPRAPSWSAITYGVPGCEDGRIARRAAASLGATWHFVRLYDGDWLDRRTRFVQQTDGLIQLSDLMHLEALPLQVDELDVHLSGYIGDAVAGPTFNDVQTREAALIALPYYDSPLGLGWHGAIERLERMTSDPSWLASRFLLFEHKLPQSTNRWTAAWRPWIRVRKPFTDYEFFDYCQTRTRTLRGEGRIYERWLRARYPAAFRAIPNHRTGAPAAAAPWRVVLARASRAGRRIWLRAAGAAHLPHAPWSRSYADDEGEWSRPAVRARIESTILAPDAIAVQLFGRPAVAAVVSGWFDRHACPTQVIGALYVYEAYHRDLGRHLTAARDAAAAAWVRRMATR
jgi:asparagine synthase (glutamine-hydrolysing)